MVVDADLDGVASAPPMDRGIARPQLGDGTDIDDAGLGVGGLRQDGFDDVFCCRDIDASRALWLVVGPRLNHASDVQDVIGSRDAVENVFVSRQIAPYDADFSFVRCEFLFVDFTRSCQNDEVKMVESFGDFLQASRAHDARGARHENRLLRVRCRHVSSF